MKHVACVLLLAAAVAVAGCQPPPEEPAAEDDPGTVTAASGLKYLVLEPGTGEAASPGQTVTVHYTGRLRDTGEVFDSSHSRGEPFSFRLGAGRVIAGWDEGVAGMRVGETRRLTIPPGLGYGDRGAPPAIPSNATLVFEVELLAVEPAGEG